MIDLKGHDRARRVIVYEMLKALVQRMKDKPVVQWFSTIEPPRYLSSSLSWHLGPIERHYRDKILVQIR